MTSSNPRNVRWTQRAALAGLALAACALAHAACGGGNSCTQCPTYDDGTGPGWCAPGPDDCQACKVVKCPGYCFYNGAELTPVPCDGGGG